MSVMLSTQYTGRKTKLLNSRTSVYNPFYVFGNIQEGGAGKRQSRAQGKTEELIVQRKLAKLARCGVSGRPFVRLGRVFKSDDT